MSNTKKNGHIFRGIDYNWHNFYMYVMCERCASCAFETYLEIWAVHACPPRRYRCWATWQWLTGGSDPGVQAIQCMLENVTHSTTTAISQCETGAKHDAQLCYNGDRMAQGAIITLKKDELSIQQTPDIHPTLDYC